MHPIPRSGKISRIDRTSVDGGSALTRTDCGEDVLVALVPDGTGYGVGEAEGHACLLARSPAILRLLREVQGPVRRRI